MPEPYTTRPATVPDATFLRLMLYEAVVGVQRDRPPVDDVLARPAVAQFLAGWGRPGDHGIIAELDGQPVGAAWFRLFQEDDPEVGFVGGTTPELVVGLEPEHRGRGVGGQLLLALMEKAAQEGYAAIGLNVPRGNLPAVSLFRRLGFESKRERDGIITMLRPLA